jgi:hypothetical protein
VIVPDGGAQLSEGLVVEASLVARLLRLRLLVIDARLIMAPAHVKGRGQRAADAVEEPLALGTPRTRTRPIGAGLAFAEQRLSDAAASLARSRS